MQEVALQPQMRKLWRAIKLFGVPITHPYIQQLTDFDLDFLEWSAAYDNPKFREKMQNTVYDDDFDDFWEGNTDVHGKSPELSDDDLVEMPTKIPDIVKKFQPFLPTDFINNNKPQELQPNSDDTDKYEDDDFDILDAKSTKIPNDWEVV